jgi:hypothetical protein
MAETNKRGPKTVTKAHKAAMAIGRAESRAVSVYLNALEANKPKRGRKRTPDSVRSRLDAIAGEIDDVDVMTRLRLVQEQMDLTAELADMEATTDVSNYEADFIDVAHSYSQRRGISYAAWREIGVPASILRQAGISRART